MARAKSYHSPLTAVAVLCADTKPMNEPITEIPSHFTDEEPALDMLLDGMEQSEDPEDEPERNSIRNGFGL